MPANNPNFLEPSALRKVYSRFSLETHRFSGPKTRSGYVAGVPLMYDAERRELVVDQTDTHTLVYGATGSLKSRAVVMPTIRVLGCAGESMVINDSKGELYLRLAGTLKEQGYHIVTLNFRDPSVGNAWNPLWIPWRYYLAGDLDKASECANDVANALMLAEVSHKDPFWDFSSSDMLFGLILLLFRYCKEYGAPEGSINISSLLNLRRTLYAEGTEARNSQLWKWAERSDELIAASLSGSINAPNNTMHSILSTFDQKMRSFTIQPTLLDMLANNDFDVQDIGNQKTAVFLITPDEKTSYHRLVSLFIKQSYEYIVSTATVSGGRVKNRINYILDEFSSLPTITDFPSMISAARSRDIRFLLVSQSKGQLVQRYQEEAATICANCTNWIFLTSRELELLRELEAMCGTKKDRTPNISVFELQHFSKERSEALLLCGRLKPCRVNLLDIDRFGERKYPVLDFRREPRQGRYLLSFQMEKRKTAPAIEERRDEEKPPRSGERSSMESGSKPRAETAAKIEPEKKKNQPESPKAGSESHRSSTDSIEEIFRQMRENNKRRKEEQKAETLARVLKKIDSRLEELRREEKKQTDSES